MVYQTLLFPAEFIIWVFCCQTNNFRNRIKYSGLYLSFLLQVRPSWTTWRRCMAASATPYAKDLWCPIFRYRDCCFLIVIPLVMIFLMGVSTTPILMKCFLSLIRVILIVGLPRIILFGVKWFVENGVLVRQLRPKASATSLQPICVSQLADNSWIASTSPPLLTDLFMSVNASSPSIQLLNGSASRNANVE